MLVCTDVASRGLDVKDITHVINYSIPRELDNYVHRIGRTARSGKSGFAMSLVTQSHFYFIPRIERMTNSRMIEGIIPTHKEITEKKFQRILKLFQEQTNFSRAISFMGNSWKSNIEKMTGEEIAARFLVMGYPDIFNNGERNNHHALTGDDPRREERREHREQRSDSRSSYRAHSNRSERPRDYPQRSDRNRGDSRNSDRPREKSFRPDRHRGDSNRSTRPYEQAKRPDQKRPDTRQKNAPSKGSKSIERSRVVVAPKTFIPKKATRKIIRKTP